MFALAKLFLLLLVAVFGNSSNPVLKIKQGILQGKYLKTDKGRTFSAFTAIPYAQPPVGDLRFKVAQPAGPWNGILNATKPHAVCPQSDIFLNSSIVGNEDCLYLNVYTPQPAVSAELWQGVLDATKPHAICPQIDVFFNDYVVKGDEDCLYLNVYTPQLKFAYKKLLPVMIFIHGGGFLLGNGNQHQCHPSLLLDKDIVLVVPNYRLGPLGFLSTGDDIVPGNNGLKDQNLAIKWTKANIYHFGGNPESITIFGQSAGGASAHFHMLSPLSKDLINGVISESGTALAVWALAPNDQGLRNSRKLADSFNCSTKCSREMIECLRKVDAYAITKQQNMFAEWNTDPMIPFKPVIEPNLKEAFLPEHPIDIIKSGKAAKVPFITGITTEDGAMKSPAIFGNPHLLDEFSKDFDRIAPITLLYDETAPDKDYVTKRIKEFYFGNRTIDNCSRSEVTNMYTDDMFFSSVNDVVRLHVNYTKEQVYYYAFGYRGSVSHSEIFGDAFHDYGVSHGDELLYLFSQNFTFPNYMPSSIDRNITEILTTLWTNFAKTGNPTPSTNSIISTIWKPVETDNLEFYFIRNVTDIRMAEKLYHERAEFWKDLPVN